MAEPHHAAGFVLYRERPEGRRYLLLRNARHGTWGFPKGHRDAGEDDLGCARRELAEETRLEPSRIDDGFRRITRYTVRKGDERAEKVVTYFLAAVSPDATLTISPEHDEARWLDLEEALATLQWQDLRDILRAAHGFLRERNDDHD